YQNDFVARINWSVTDNYKNANHNPIAVLNGDKTRQVLNMNATAGSTVELSADGSTDPDGDSLSYSWFFYDEPSSYDGKLTIKNSSSSTSKLKIPNDAAGKNVHIILQVHDDGTPNLTAYRRMIINVK